MSAAPAAQNEGPLALLCGGGTLPLAVADYVIARGREVLLFPLRGVANSAGYAGRAHHWLYLGQYGKLERLATAAGCRDIVLIGSLVRPSLWQLRFDFKALTKLPRMVTAFDGGDDYLLTRFARVLEESGFRVLGAHEVAPEILVPEGPLGKAQSSERDRADIAFGLDYLRATSPFDVGQAVVVSNKHVWAVEAAEGTDQMLARVADMRANGRLHAPAGTGVLVKAPKVAQDRRFDLPSIGPHTVEGAARADLAGIAVAAGETIIAEPERLVQAADRAKIFVIGLPAGKAR